MGEVRIHRHYLDALGRVANRLRLDNQLLLEHAGLRGDERDRVPVDGFVEYCSQFWLWLDDELFGLTGQPCRPGSFKFLADQCMGCLDLRQVFEKAQHFYALFTGLRLEIREEGDQAILSLENCRPELDPEHVLIEFVLTSWHRFASWMIGNQVVLNLAEFSYAPPGHVTEYQYLFPALHRFNAPRSAIVFSAEYLDQPIVREPDQVGKFLHNFPFAALVRPKNDHSFTTRVRTVIRQDPGYPVLIPEFDKVAGQMNLTTSTLRRKLKSEGTSYQQIKDLLRRDLAISHMQSEALSIGEIAHRVGFAEAGAFIRAFKNWTGVTPGYYRSAWAGSGAVTKLAECGTVDALHGCVSSRNVPRAAG